MSTVIVGANVRVRRADLDTWLAERTISKTGAVIVKAEGILMLLSAVRRTGDDRWSARCPAHDDRKPSLSVRQADDRVLLHCHAGCTVEDICGALGLTLADLYEDGRHSRPDPRGNLRRLAAAGLERWRQTELQRSAEELRLRDALSRAITDAVQAGAVTEVEAWDALEEAYA